MGRFLHLADVHLGTSQYHNAERNADFFKAFWGVVERHALSGDVDFVLIAGDLFDKRQIDAPTLGQATAVLRRLADKGIPVCGVEGNHDRAYYGEGSSWLEYLNALGLLRLLRNDVDDDGQAVLRPWEAGQKPGAYTDIGDIRIIGSRYYGASTAKAIAPIAEAIKGLPAAPFTVLMWHMGVEGYISALAGGVSISQLAPLRGCTDYLALGHVHQRYSVDDWLYNPGSLEACNVVESTLDHGAYLVTVDHTGHLVEPVEDYPRRPFRRLSFDLTPFDAPAEFQAALPEFLAGQLKQSFILAPVIELSLIGTCRFSRSALDLDWIRQMVVAACAPLLVLVRNLSGSSSTAIAPDAHSAMDRRELEGLILQDCFAQDSRFRPSSRRCSQLLLDLKNRLENGEKPTSLLTYLKEAVPEALRQTEQPGDGEQPAREAVAAASPPPEPIAAAEPAPLESPLESAEPIAAAVVAADPLDDDDVPDWDDAPFGEASVSVSSPEPLDVAVEPGAIEPVAVAAAADSTEAVVASAIAGPAIEAARPAEPAESPESTAASDGQLTLF